VESGVSLGGKRHLGFLGLPLAFLRMQVEVACIQGVELILWCSLSRTEDDATRKTTYRAASPLVWTWAKIGLRPSWAAGLAR
jgi:hypothetical protein